MRAIKHGAAREGGWVAARFFSSRATHETHKLAYRGRAHHSLGASTRGRESCGGVLGFEFAHRGRWLGEFEREPLQAGVVAD